MKKVLFSLLFLSAFAHSALAGRIVVATSDYESANTAVYDTKTETFIASALGQADQDVVVDTDGEYVYFLSRSLGSIAKYKAAEIGTESVSGGLVWEYSVGPDTNPYDIVFLESKAYVICFASKQILIVDPDAETEEAFQTGTIDISTYDENGAPEAVYGFVYDDMVYVVLQRLNGYSAEIPGYMLKIDPSTNEIVDLDSDTEGVQGMELLVMNPQSFSQNGATAYISGHAWGVQTEGVQTIDLGSAGLTQTMLLDEEELFMDITGVNVFNDEYGIFYSSAWVQDGDEWVQQGAAYWFDPRSGEVGETLPVPTPDGGAVLVDGLVYVGSRDNVTLGVYPVDPATNTLAGEILASSLPPTSMVYIESDTPIFVEEDEAAPGTFVLGNPYPNPFNPATTLSFTLSGAGMTQVDVFNVAGQKVDTLLSGHLAAGNHTLVWNAENMSNGVYFFRVTHDGMVKNTKALLVK